MALLDVSEVLLDPDFTNVVTLIKRTATVNEHGETVLAETPCHISAVVQGDNPEVLERLPQGARLSDIITVYTRADLEAESEGGYADVVVWRGKRYQVQDVAEDFMNYGAGFTKAFCMLEAAHV